MERSGVGGSQREMVRFWGVGVHVRVTVVVVVVVNGRDWMLD